MKRTTAILLVTVGLSLGCARQPDAPDRTVDVAARVGTQTITLEQVDARVQEAEPEAWQSLYEARQRALAFLIDAQLVQAEAERQGVEEDSLVRREVNDRMVAVSDSAVGAFYDWNQQRLDGQPLAAVEDRIRQHLTVAEHRRAWGDYLSRLRHQAGVEIMLEPPRARIVVGDGEPSMGSPQAPVVLVEYSDYECPYCARTQPAVKEVMQVYGDQVRLVYRDFPLSIHANARNAARAALCAQEQGRFWEYHDLLFANQGELDSENLRRLAAGLGLDAAVFDACLASGRHDDAIDADLISGERHGVTGTPAFFINGRRLSGAQPFSAFKELIDDELARIAPTGI